MGVLFIIWFSRAENIPVKENDVAVENFIAEDVDWAQLFVGSIVGMSQVDISENQVGLLEYILYYFVLLNIIQSHHILCIIGNRQHSSF